MTEIKAPRGNLEGCKRKPRTNVPSKRLKRLHRLRRRNARHDGHEIGGLKRFAERQAGDNNDPIAKAWLKNKARRS